MEEALSIFSAKSVGQQQNITYIIKSMSRRLLGFIKKRIKSNEDAVNILQEVFISLRAAWPPSIR